MIVTDTALQGFTIQYPVENLCEPEKILFLDIETTGFTARSSLLYLIGCAYFKEDCWHTIQWMMENSGEEADLLNAFFQFAADFQFLIHFNGNNFDLPYLVQKCAQLALPCDFSAFEGLDLYRRVSPYKTFLNLPNCKQKTLEYYLDLERKDIYNGGELIGIYQDYLSHPDAKTADLLLLHNAEDIRGMLSVLPMLAYHDALNLPLKARKVQANHYRDSSNVRRTELLITVTLPTQVPKPVRISSSGFYASLKEQQCELRVPVYEEELKYFYSNYKDYYYLPEEDLALHKSVATFVDREHRRQATAQTCYTRKYSEYLRQWGPVFTPFFKKDYQSQELYFELTDEMKKNRSAFASYASHILNMLAGDSRAGTTF